LLLWGAYAITMGQNRLVDKRTYAWLSNYRSITAALEG
jgi:hypothetical protein